MNKQGESWRVSGHSGGAYVVLNSQEKGRSHARCSIKAQINPPVFDLVLEASGATKNTQFMSNVRIPLGGSTEGNENEKVSE